MNDQILEIAGAVLVVAGLVLWSPTIALIIAGVLLLAHTNRPRKTAPNPVDSVESPAGPGVL